MAAKVKVPVQTQVREELYDASSAYSTFKDTDKCQCSDYPRVHVHTGMFYNTQGDWVHEDGTPIAGVPWWVPVLLACLILGSIPLIEFLF